VTTCGSRELDHQEIAAESRPLPCTALSTPGRHEYGFAMRAVVVAVVGSIACVVRSRWALQLEVLALRHQLAVFQRGGRRPHLEPADRILWAWLSRVWPAWREALVFVQPRTVIVWQQKRFRDHWTCLSRRGRIGRPPVAKAIRNLIRTMSDANPTWGSPRIVGELRELGIEVAKSTVETYRVRRHKPPSPTWRTFLASHATELVAIDFFTVATVRFEILFVLVVLAHDRRRVRHFGITGHPTAAWTAQQLVEAFPWETAPRHLLRDRDAIYGLSTGGEQHRWASRTCARRRGARGSRPTSSA
jgi:putative transposase